MGKQIVRRIEIKAPVSRVWQALTDYRQFGEWFRVKLNGPFVVGERSLGEITYPGYQGLKWEAVIRKLEPETLFSYIWPPGAAPGEGETEKNWTLVEFRLEKIPSGTLLTVTESGFDRVPANRRDAAFRDNSEGWSIQVNNLAEYVTWKSSPASGSPPTTSGRP